MVTMNDMTKKRGLSARLAVALIVMFCSPALMMGPLAAPAHAALIDGTPGDDVIDGTADADQIFGFEGDDTLRGLGGDDQLWGAEGDDRLYGGEGDDFADGGPGTDNIEGNAGNDNLYGGAGSDFIYGGPGSDYLAGDGGDFGDTGDDGDDFLYGGAGDDTILGDGGNDYIEGGIGDDTIDGGTGDDTIYGDGGDDILSGGDGNDTIYGNAGTDELDGGAGNDRLCGGGDPGDELIGGPGNDLACAHDDGGAIQIGKTIAFDPTTNDEDLLDDGFEDSPSVYSLIDVPAELDASIDPATGVITLSVADPTYTGGVFTYRVTRTHPDGDLSTEADVTITVLPAAAHTVVFDTKGGTSVPDVTVDDGDTLAAPADPTREGHAFTGWYTNPDATAAYDFATPVTGDLMLYAGWKDSSTPDDDTPADDGETPGDDDTPAGDGGTPGDDTSTGGGQLPDTGSPIGWGTALAGLLAITAGSALLLLPGRTRTAV